MAISKVGLFPSSCGRPVPEPEPADNCSVMRADVFQVVALSCHANALSGEVERSSEFLAQSSFLPVHEILFERSGPISSGVVADSVLPWLRRLQKESIERLEISLRGCPLDPLAAPTRPWGILTDGDAGLEIWEPEWRKRLRSHSDSSPWCVRYISSRISRWNVMDHPSLVGAAEDLSAALVEVGRVHSSLRALSAGPSPFPDIFPAGWPEACATTGARASRVAAFLRSDAWAEIAHRREIPGVEHAQIGERLWSVAISALEAASDPAAAVWESSTDHSSRRTA